MSPLDQTSYLTWKTSSNPMAIAYRESLLPQGVSQTSLMIWGVASNAFKAIGHAFAALTSNTWNLITCQPISLSHWQLSKIYFSFTLLCLKAMWNFQATAEHWHLISAKSCLHHFLDKHIAQSSRSNVHVDCIPGTLSYDEMRADLTRLYKLLTTPLKHEFVTHMKSCLESLDSFPDDLQIHILKFLDPLRADPEIESLIHYILHFNFQPHNRVFIISNDGEAQFLPLTCFENNISLFFADTDFTPSLETAKAENYCNGLKLKPEYDSQFINNLKLITACDPVEWGEKTKHLYENLSFLSQLASRDYPGAKSVYHDYLAAACENFISKLFKDEYLDDDQFNKLLTLSNKTKNNNLKEVVYLYYFRRFSIKMHVHIHESLKQNMSAIIELLFQNTLNNKIHFVPTFIRLLTFNIYYDKPPHYKATPHIISLCEQAGQRECYSRFMNIPPIDLKDAQKEFMETWENYPRMQHLDVCLAIYKCKPTDYSKHDANALLFPTLDVEIPELAYAVQTDPKTFHAERDEILSLMIERIHIESAPGPLNIDCMHRIFRDLQLAHERNFNKLKNSCVKRILDVIITVHEGISIISGIATEEQLALFFDSLKQYTGPQRVGPEEKIRAHIPIKNEGIALLKFARQQLVNGKKSNYDSCVNYLRSKTQYMISARQFSGQQETELFQICSSEPT